MPPNLATAGHNGEFHAASGLAVVIGARGGLGAALCQHLRRDARYAQVLAAGRRPDAAKATTTADSGIDLCIDLLDETSIAEAAAQIDKRAQGGLPLRLVIDATGFLHGNGFEPEKSWRQLDAAHMAHAFAVNAIGPALLMKHFLPLLPRSGKAV